MVESRTIELEIRCLSCGYQLRGLSQSVCPECGRAFDPSDPKTFESRPPEWRRRRRFRRAIALVVVVLALVAAFPRRLLIGQIQFTCNNCGIEQTAYRWEPMLPSWIGVRMPAVHWRTRFHRKTEDNGQNCTTHFFGRLNVKFDFPIGQAKANFGYGAKETPSLNGQLTTPDTAMDVLRNLMSPANRGIGG